MRVLRGVMYMTKSSGPRTEPWGTPQEETCQEDSSLSSHYIFIPLPLSCHNIKCMSIAKMHHLITNKAATCKKIQS